MEVIQVNGDLNKKNELKQNTNSNDTSIVISVSSKKTPIFQNDNVHFDFKKCTPLATNN